MVVGKKSGTVRVRYDKKLTKRVKSVEMTGKTKSVNFPSTKLDFVGGYIRTRSTHSNTH